MDVKQNQELTLPQPTPFSQPQTLIPTIVIESKQEEEEVDDDLPSLSPFALQALQQFLAEQQPPPSTETPLNQSNASKDAVELVSEDWRLSQFWYSPATANAVADEVVTLINHFFNGGDEFELCPSVACISCPTLFAYLQKKYPNVSAQLLEYDERFEQYGSKFTFYDYNEPEELPQTLKHSYQIIVVDPPYLSKECLEKTAQTIGFLAHPGKFYLLLLTGEVQTDLAAKLLESHPCGFRPQHASKLGNEFRLFTNYDPRNRLGGWDMEEKTS